MFMLDLCNHMITNDNEIALARKLLPHWKPEKKMINILDLSREEVVDDFGKQHILKIGPSVTLAKSVKMKDLVFALHNCEIIKAMWNE